MLNATTNTTPSASVRVGPRDSRCRYWAKIVRAGQPLPTPASVGGAASIPGAYLRNGEEELFPGDVLIEGEEMHHRKARGWTYRTAHVTAAGELVYTTPSAEIKAAMKAAGLPAELLPGSGDLAACVRIAHGLRLGLL